MACSRRRSPEDIPAAHFLLFIINHDNSRRRK
jgi:hypothetical protein